MDREEGLSVCCRSTGSAPRVPQARSVETVDRAVSNRFSVGTVVQDAERVAPGLKGRVRDAVLL
jgi:hypothetical protein